MDKHGDITPLRWKFFSVLTAWLFLISALVHVAGCGGGGGGTPPASPPVETMTLQVKVPSNTPGGETIYLRTGMLFGVDEQEVAMSQVSAGIWQAAVTAPEGTILRYRYSRNQDWDKEEVYVLRDHVQGFHSREALVRKGGTVSEAIAKWEDLSLVSGSTGTLTGTVKDGLGNPLMGIRVSAGPHQTMTRWDGTYRVYGVPAGPCEITFRADNGEYTPARTAATVLSSGTTTANITMAAATMVNVTFNVIVPAGTPAGAVPRLYGDTFRLGMFPVNEGTAVESARMIDMSLVSGTTWSYTANLGTGSCYNYTYTLGYNHLNNERDSSGNAVVRSFCVTGTMIVSDTVASWKAPWQVPVTLTATSPTGTADTLYVTTDDWGGYAPMKMWSSGTDTATYTLYVNSSETVTYRYVRNGDPAIGLEIVGTDADPPAYRMVSSGASGITVDDTISAWRHQMHDIPLSSVTTSMTGTIVSRTTGSFQTGVELIDYWRPSWRPLVGPTLDRIASKNAQWVQIASVWGIMNMDNPVVEPGWNSFTPEELVEHIRTAKAKGLKVALRGFAYPAGGDEETAFAVSHDTAWYDQFFSEVKATFLYHAAIAQQEGVDLLILSNFSWAADDADAAKAAYINGKWKNDIIPAVKAVYTGKLANDTFNNGPYYDWYAGLDYIGDIWWVPLTSSSTATIGDMYATAMSTLNTYYSNISTTYGKPILFTEIGYYSADTSAKQAYQVTSNEIHDFLPSDPAVLSDYDEQARAYQATLLAFAETPWVQGCYSFGYAYFDFDSKGYSVRGKTAEEVMSQIYGQLNAN